MKRLIVFLTFNFTLLAVEPASARCYTDQCAEDRISAIFTFLPITIWGLFLWAAFSDEFKGSDKTKDRTFQIIVCLAFIPVWWLTSLLL
jgi:hypothetical protein